MSKLYLEAGKVVDQVITNHVGLKTALYEKPLASDPRAVYKLAASTLARRSELTSALRSAGLIDEAEKEEAKVKAKAKAPRKKKIADRLAQVARSPGVAMVMAFDMCLGQGLRGGGRLKRQLVENKELLSRELEDAGVQMKAAKAARDAGDKEEAVDVYSALPRYLRISRTRLPEKDDVKMATKELMASLKKRVQDEADEKEKEKKETMTKRNVTALSSVAPDNLVPDLLMCHPQSGRFLQGMPEIEQGTFVLQDRSSCLAALSAGLKKGDVVLDACAAPGSKTAHAIDLLKGKGRVLAFEKDQRRATALVSRLQSLTEASAVQRKRKRQEGDQAKKESKEVEGEPPKKLPKGALVRMQAGEVRAEVRVGDFLSTDPWQKGNKKADVIFVDPTCSGTGLPEHHLLGGNAAKPSEERLQKLAAFQTKILSHALKFPGARTVIYSTCSTCTEENEDVVKACLEKEPNKTAWKVVEALSWWKNAKGEAHSQEEWAPHCIRCRPDAHRCRGFFLCRLDRIPGEPGAKKALRPLPPKKRRRRKKAAEPKAAAAPASKPKRAAGSFGRKGKGLVIAKK